MILHGNYILKLFSKKLYSYVSLYSTISGRTDLSNKIKGLISSDYIQYGVIYNDFYLEGYNFKITGSFDTKTINVYGKVPDKIVNYFNRRGFRIENIPTIFEPIINNVSLLYNPLWELLIPSRYITSYNKFGTPLYNKIKQLSKYNYGIIYDFSVNTPLIYVTFYDELKILSSIFERTNILDFIIPALRSRPEFINKAKKLLQLENPTIQNYKLFTIILDTKTQKLYTYNALSNELLEGQIEGNKLYINNKEYNYISPEIISKRKPNTDAFSKFINLDNFKHIYYNMLYYPEFSAYYEFGDIKLSLSISNSPTNIKAIEEISKNLLSNF